MSAITKIEWTDRSWSPVRGCSVISSGCINCYAMKQGHRFSGPGKPYEGLTKQTKAGPQWTGVVRTVESALLEPLSWRKPQRIFVNSMSDLFHEDVPFEFIDKVFAVMGLSNHTFQILTKRADRMRAYVERVSASATESHRDWPELLEAQMPWLTEQIGERRMLEICETPDKSNAWPHPNVWLGVSVEDQKHADERIPHLMRTSAAVRFISAEPLLGAVDLRQYLDGTPCDHKRQFCEDIGCWGPFGLDWVIVGGESGAGARPFDIAWARSIVKQCADAGVACFVKQLGAVVHAEDYLSFPGEMSIVPREKRVYLQNSKGGDPSEWPDDLRIRQFPVSA